MVKVALELLGGKVIGLDESFVTDIAYTKDEIDSKLTAVLRFKGTKATKDELPTTGNTRGDVWAVTQNNLEFVWLKDSSSGSVSDWEQLGPIHDLSAYYTKDEINTMLGNTDLLKTKSVTELIGLDGTEGKSLKQLITELTTRVGTAEGDIDSLEGRMDTAEGNITSIGERITTAEGNVSALGGRVTAVEGDIDTLEGRADALETVTNEHTSKLATAESNIGTLQTKATEIFSRVGDGPYKTPVEPQFLEDFEYYKKNADETFTLLVAGTDYNVGDAMRTGVYRSYSDKDLSERMFVAEQTAAGLSGRMTTVEETVSTMEANVNAAKKQSTDALGRIGNGAYKVPTTTTFQSDVVYAVKEEDLTFTQIIDFTVGDNIADYEAEKGKTVYYQSTTKNISERMADAEGNVSTLQTNMSAAQANIADLQNDVWSTLPEQIDNVLVSYDYSFDTKTLSKPGSSKTSTECWNELGGKLADGRPIRLTTSDCEVFGSTLTDLRLSSCGNVISTAEYDPDDPTTQTGWDRTRMLYFCSRITEGHLSQIQIKLHWHNNMIGGSVGNTVADSIEPLLTVCKNDYDKLEKLEDYLYYIEFSENYEYDRCLNYFGRVRPTADAGGCTSIRKGNFFARNLDWTYNDKAKFVIRTKKTGTRHASIAMGGNTNMLTDELVNSRVYSPYYFVLPFITTDGINDAGVCVSSHVVPTGDYGTTTGTMSTGAALTLCNYMVPRYILDNFESAKEAVEYIRDHVNVFCALKEVGGSVTEECAYFVADAVDTYLIEFINNSTRVIHLDGDEVSSADKLPTWEANFYRTDKDNTSGNIVLDGDNKVSYTSSKITSHGQGLERWNKVAAAYDSLSSAPDMMRMLKDLWYTKSYGTEEDPIWLSEFVEGSLTIDMIPSEPEAFDETLQRERTKFANRSRDPSSDNFGTWETVHSAVYDIEKQRLWITFEQQTLETGRFFSLSDEDKAGDHSHAFVECWDSVSTASAANAMHFVPATKSVGGTDQAGYYCEAKTLFLYNNGETWHLNDLSGVESGAAYNGTKDACDLIFQDYPAVDDVTIMHRSESTVESDRIVTGSPQAVLDASTQPLVVDTYSANTDVLLSRHKTYYKLVDSVYTPLVLGTDYEAREYSGVNGVYERTGTGTYTYQSDMTATFLADKIYATYRTDLQEYQVLEAVASDPGYYQYVPGTTTFGDKQYEVFLHDPFVYTLSSDTAAVADKVYCERVSGSGTEEDPYKYKVWDFVVGRPFALYVKDGVSLSQVVTIVNQLIAPHKKTA